MRHFSIPGDPVLFPGHLLKNWDCPDKSGMDGHLMTVAVAVAAAVVNIDSTPLYL